ncbi:MAG: hypothetical protein F6K24_31340, partial [Okeania sp. SIO2D1]|nr:hypothetical protein [Okeania sp. SIO2D1]
VEYLHFGGGKAEGRRQEAEGKKRLEGKKFFIALLSGHDISPQSSGGNQEEEKRESFFYRVSGTEFYRALIS